MTKIVGLTKRQASTYLCSNTKMLLLIKPTTNPPPTMATRFLPQLLRPLVSSLRPGPSSALRSARQSLLFFRPALIQPTTRAFTTNPPFLTTLNQVLRGCRVPQRARRAISPALKDRPHLKGVCLKVGITKPKKPNSGERKTARVRLSSGRSVTAYIMGEGM